MQQMRFMLWHFIPCRFMLGLFIGLLALINPATAMNPIEEITTPKNIHAWLIQDDTAPVIAISFLFKGAGAINDDKDLSGLANLAASLLDEGASDYDDQAFRQLLEDKSIHIRFDAGLDDLSGTMISLTRHLDDATHLLKLALNQPRFDEAPLLRIRQQIIASINHQKSDPSQIAHQGLMKILFQDHPYGQNSKGEPETLLNITKADLQEFVDHHLTLANLYIGVSGPINKADLALLLDDIFGDLPAGKKTKTIKQSPNLDGQIHHIKLDVPQSAIRFALPGIAFDDADYFAARLLNHIYGGGSFESKLMQEIRAKRGLAYGTYSYLATMDEATILMGGMGTRTETVNEAIDVAKSITNELRQANYQTKDYQDKLEQAKAYIKGSYLINLTSANAVATRLAGLQSLGLNRDYFDVRPSLIDAVTAKDLSRVAKRIFIAEKMTWVVVGRTEDGVEND